MIKKHKIFSWVVTKNCNYSCSYCIAGTGKEKISVNPRDPLKIFDKLRSIIPGEWDVFITGGEPFVTPKFLKLAENIIKAGYKIHLTTNFSAPYVEITKFLDITKGKLIRFNASLHLEHAKMEDFFKKAIFIQDRIGPLFRVTAVATKDGKNNVKKLAEIGKKFRQKGMKFQLVAQKIYAEPEFIDYTAKERKSIASFGRTLGLENPDHRGEKCQAGVSYFALYPNGDAFRCHQASKETNGYLGNPLKGNFKLYKNPKPCLYECCSCPIPQYDQESDVTN